MPHDQPKVLLLKLFERTCANGKRYMSGRLGNARVIAFMDDTVEKQFGAEAVWNVFLEPGDDSRRPAAGTDSAAAASASRSNSGTAESARRSRTSELPLSCYRTAPSGPVAEPGMNDEIPF